MLEWLDGFKLGKINLNIFFELSNLANQSHLMNTLNFNIKIIVLEGFILI